MKTTATYPVQTPDRRGFTLLEVLAALLVVVVTFGAVASVLLTSLRSEEVTRHLEDGLLAVETISALSFAGLPTDAYERSLGEQWFVEKSAFESKSIGGPPWTIWNLSPRARTSLDIRWCLQQSGAGS